MNTNTQKSQQTLQRENQMKLEQNIMKIHEAQGQMRNEKNQKNQAIQAAQNSQVTQATQSTKMPAGRSHEEKALEFQNNVSSIGKSVGTLAGQAAGSYAGEYTGTGSIGSSIGSDVGGKVVGDVYSAYLRTVLTGNHYGTGKFYVDYVKK